MNIILDTHILLWTLADDPKLPQEAREMIEDTDNDIYFSIISEWEIEIKHILHADQMSLSGKELSGYCRQSGFRMLGLGEKDISMLHTLNRPDSAPRHKDPFDRMLICQAKSNGFVLLTHDRLLKDYAEPCVVSVKTELS